MKSTAFYTLLLLLISGLNPARASHIVSADISYACTSTPGTWKITLVQYRDCGSSSGQTVDICTGNFGTPCPQTLNITGASPACNGASFGTLNLNLVSVSDVGYNPLCPSSKNYCSNMGQVARGTYPISIEKYVFEGFADLSVSSGIPSNCCQVRFSFYNCCRSTAINTGAGSQGIYNEAIIDRCLALTSSPGGCNSAPRFVNDPLAVLCQGVPVILGNAAAVDPDHDSLSYAFTPALQSQGSPVSYYAPLAYDEPMPYVYPKSAPYPAGMRCDPLTGEISFTPNVSGSSNMLGLMAVEVKQWMYVNGVAQLAGVTRREIYTYILSTCTPNNLPSIRTNPTTAPAVLQTQWSATPNTQLCFDIIAKDTDFNLSAVPPRSDTTYLSWDSSLFSKGATFTRNYTDSLRKTSGPREDSWKFCWTPTSAHISTLPWYFNITAKDNRCPAAGFAARSFAITVRQPASATIVKTAGSCKTWNVSYTTPAASSIVSTKWLVAAQPGAFNSAQAITYNNVQNLNLSFSDTGKFVIKLVLNEALGDEKNYYDTIRAISFTPALVGNTYDTIVCSGSPVKYSIQMKYGTAPYTYSWKNSASVLLSSADTMQIKPTTPNQYYVSVTDANNCRVADTFTVIVKAGPVSLLPASMRICSGTSYTLDPGNNAGNPVTYLWSTGDTTRTLTRNDSNTFYLAMTASNGCVTKDTLPLFVNRPFTANAGNDTVFCGTKTITLHASGGQLYQWKNLKTNTTITSKTSSANATASVTGTISFEASVYVTQSSVECVNKDTITATANTAPVLTRPQPVQLCRNAGTTNLYPLSFNAVPVGGSAEWSYPPAPGALYVTRTGVPLSIDSLKNLPAPSPATSKDNWVRYTYTASAADGLCAATDSVIIRVYSSPVADAGPHTILCSNSAVFSITGNTQFTYAPKHVTGDGATELWTGNGIVQAGTGSSAVFTFDPAKTGVALLPQHNIITYLFTQTYTATGSPVCSGTDTMLFDVVPAGAIVDAGVARTLCSGDPLFNLTLQQAAFPPGGVWSAAPVSQSGSNYMFNPAIASLSPSVNKLFYQFTGSCASGKDSVLFTVNPTPVLPVISGPASVPALQANNFTVISHSGNSYNWLADQGNISTGQGTNAVSAVFNNAGSAMLKVIETSSGCNSDTAKKTITVTGSTGIQENAAFDQFNLYPNPTTGLLNIELNTDEKLVHIEVIDVLGKTVKAAHYEHSGGHFAAAVDLGMLKSGLYFIRTKAGNRSVQSRVTLK